MPLINQHLPTLSSRHASTVDLHYELPYADHYSEYEDDEGEMSDSSMMHRGRPKKAIRMPVISAKAQLRTSRILENLEIQLKELEKAAKFDKKHGKSSLDIEDPHESYLSSEEDDSESTTDESVDDYSESYVEIDSEDGRPSSSASSHRSIEETAKAICFVFVGKPSVISITLPPTLTSMSMTPPTTKTPSRSSSLQPPTQKSKPTSYPTTSYIPPRRPSKHNTATSPSLPPLPPQKAARRPSATPLPSISTRPARTSSLSQSTIPNAFPASEASEVQITSPISPETPHSALTPISASTENAAYSKTGSWRSGLGRMVAARKRPSMPSLSLAFKTPSSSGSNSREEQHPRNPISIPEEQPYSHTSSTRGRSPTRAPAPAPLTKNPRRNNRLSLNLSAMNISPGFSAPHGFGLGLNSPSRTSLQPTPTTATFTTTATAAYTPQEENPLPPLPLTLTLRDLHEIEHPSTTNENNNITPRSTGASLEVHDSSSSITTTTSSSSSSTTSGSGDDSIIEPSHPPPQRLRHVDETHLKTSEGGGSGSGSTTRSSSKTSSGSGSGMALKVGGVSHKSSLKIKAGFGAAMRRVRAGE